MSEWRQSPECRTLTRSLKQAHYQIGRQGNTIYQQRAIIEELHSLMSKEDRGVYRRLQGQYDALYAKHQLALAEVERLTDKLKGIDDGCS